MRTKKTYTFGVDFEQEADGLWSVDLPAVPACAASGATREQALEALRDLTQAYFDVLVEHGDPLPEGVDLYEVIPGDEVAPGQEAVTIHI